MSRPHRAVASPGVPGGAHEWLSFPDGEEDRTWVFDVTFLESPWTCIFGRGCQGVLTGPAPELAQGCCSYGAHFTGPDDIARVEAAAATLTPGQWQHHDAAHSPSGALRVIERAEGSEPTTRLLDDACIFLNRPGFPGGPGCALHRAALERHTAPLELKPDVCWQLPLRMDDEVDTVGHVTTTVRQWDRRDWGDGGREFHWWCTESPSAFVGAEPVHRALRAELRALIGPSVHRRLEGYLSARSGRRRSDSTSGAAAATADLEARAPAPVSVPHPALRSRRRA